MPSPSRGARAQNTLRHTRIKHSNILNSCNNEGRLGGGADYEPDCKPNSRTFYGGAASAENGVAKETLMDLGTKSLQQKHHPAHLKQNHPSQLHSTSLAYYLTEPIPKTKGNQKGQQASLNKIETGFSASPKKTTCARKMSGNALLSQVDETVLQCEDGLIQERFVELDRVPPIEAAGGAAQWVRSFPGTTPSYAKVLASLMLLKSQVAPPIKPSGMRCSRVWYSRVSCGWVGIKN